jgi:diacylglycerol kinase family enzyme
MGFDAFISMKFANAGKRGPTTYIETVLKEGLRYKPETYLIEDETGTQQYKAFLISCANAAQYGNNAYIAPNASMADGLLDVVIMEPFNVLEASQISIQLFNRTLDKNSKIKIFRTKKLHIHRKVSGAIHYDGDPMMTGTDIDIEIVSKGIKIIPNPKAMEPTSEVNQKENALLEAFSEFFNDINSGFKENIGNVRNDIVRRNHRIQVINKVLLRKLTRK